MRAAEDPSRLRHDRRAGGHATRADARTCAAADATRVRYTGAAETRGAVRGMTLHVHAHSIRESMSDPKPGEGGGLPRGVRAARMEWVGGFLELSRARGGCAASVASSGEGGR